MKKSILVLIFAFSSLYGLNYTKFNLEPESSPPILGYVCAPLHKTSYPIVVVIQSSEVESIVTYLNEFEETADLLGIALVGIEKHGIYGPEEIDEIEYHRANYRENRIADHFYLLDQIRCGLVTGWNGEIIFLGCSEGGMIAFQVAAATPETIATLTYASGGGFEPKKEVLVAVENYLVSMGLPPMAVSLQLWNVEKQMEEMVCNPTPEKFYYDYSYQWWASHLKATSLLETALLLECPILYVHGSEDQVIPVESADKLAETFNQAGKDNMTYLRLDGITHHIFKHDVSSLKKYTYHWLSNILF